MKCRATIKNINFNAGKDKPAVQFEFYDIKKWENEDEKGNEAEAENTIETGTGFKTVKDATILETADR